MESGEDEDGSDIETLLNCEEQYDKTLEPKIVRAEIHQQSERRITEKRKEREGEGVEDDDKDDNEDDFITVNRRKPKRLNRSESTELQNKMRVDLEKDDDINNKTNYEVCITATESLPKQMALARLLRGENIKNIIRIKYKSFNKVLIQFQNEGDATNLLECQKLREMGWRCQLINEVTLTYGVVRGIDLDLKENEILDILECTTEIVSIKRLRRVNSGSKWVDSESVRVCFKSNNLPPYVYAYSCRLKVEPYVFPVSQCSGCWQFGHILKYCPTKKKICPKCGGDHENCNLIKISCLNCKGNHFVLDKNCPLFLKEKYIRNIMSAEKVTYRIALKLFLEKQRKNAGNESSTMQDTSYTTSSQINQHTRTYSSVLTNSVKNVESDKCIEIHDENSVQPEQVTGKNLVNKINKEKKRQPVAGTSSEKEEEIPSQEKEKDEQLFYRFQFRKFIFKIQRIFTLDGTFEEKMSLLFKKICEELENILLSYFLNGNLIDTINNFING